MRYKVKASTDAVYFELLSVLRGLDVPLYVTSPRRKTLATGHIPARLRDELTARGGEISVDRKYDLEAR